MGSAPESEIRHAVPVIVVGASAGGVEALRDLVATLPGDLEACVLVVLHMPRDTPSALPSILRRASTLPVRHVEDGDELLPGHVLVAPPDHHILVIHGRVALSRGPQENGHRPAVDVLFRSAARNSSGGVLGIVLSGSLDDGAAGAVAVKAAGGRVIVQNPDEALYDGMPRAAALAAGDAERLRVLDMAAAIQRWIDEGQTQRSHHHRSEIDVEVKMAELDPTAMHDVHRPGTPAGFGCPECGGSLFQIREGRLRRYRCRVGHAWSPDSLAARQTIEVESALWMALRTLEEKAALNTDLEKRARERGDDRTATRFADAVEDAVNAAELVRRLITDIG